MGLHSKAPQVQIRSGKFDVYPKGMERLSCGLCGTLEMSGKEIQAEGRIGKGSRKAENREPHNGS